MKQINFGTAVGLTQTAKDGQKASQQSLRSTFTIRNKWPEVGPLAIKITPATKAKLQSAIHTNAEFLIPHETGKDKTGRGGHRLGVPSVMLRPQGSRKILRAGMRPKALLASGKAFVLHTKRGDVIAQVKGKGQRLVVLYGLEPKVRIRKRSTFYEPIDKVVKRNLHRNVMNGIQRAFATMRK